MGYLKVKQLSEKWGISERRIINLCREGRIDGAKKNGMIWEIPEEAVKPSDKRSNIYKYINIPKRILIVNVIDELKNNLQSLLEKDGYIVQCIDYSEIDIKLNKYYEGLIYFPTNNIDKNEEKLIKDFSKRLNSESSIVIVDYVKNSRNKLEKKLFKELKYQIGLRINTLLLNISDNKDVLVNYKEISEDIVNLLTKFRNTSGVELVTDGGKLEFDENGRTKDLEIGEFYKTINNCFRKLNKESYLWCASIMLEDEWTEEPQEMKFRVINLELANRGVNVERIFIFSKDKIKEFKKNKTLKIYMQSSIKTLFADYDELKKKKPELLNIVGNGWDGINKEMLIVDLPTNRKERGFLYKNNEEVLKAYNCFQELKKYTSELKEVLK